MPQCTRWLSRVYETITRTKRQYHLPQEGGGQEDEGETGMTFSPPRWGVGNAVLLGLFLVSGNLVVNVAGPSAIVSMAVATVAATMSGLCCLELYGHSREGNLYAATYRITGEFSAFLVGWNEIMENIFLVASSARQLSLGVDFLTGLRIRSLYLDDLGWFIGEMDYPDLLAGCIIMACALVLCLRMCQFQKWWHLLMTSLALATLTIVLVSGFFYLRKRNFQGEFFFHGSDGMLSGAGLGFIITASMFTRKTSMHRVISARGTKFPTLFIVLSMTSLGAIMTTLTSVIVSLAEFPAAGNGTDVITPLLNTYALTGNDVITDLIASLSLPLVLYMLVNCLISAVVTVITLTSHGLLWQVFMNHNEGSSSRPSAAVLVCGFLATLAAIFLPMLTLVMTAATVEIVNHTVAAVACLYSRYQVIEIDDFAKDDDIVRTSQLDYGESDVMDKPDIKEAIRRDIDVVRKEMSSDSRADDHETFKTHAADDRRENVKTKEITRNSRVKKDSQSTVESSEIDEDGQSSDDTDIDAIVAEYKDRIQVAAVSAPKRFTGDDSPTVTSERKVKLAVLGLLLSTAGLSISLILVPIGHGSQRYIWLVLFAAGFTMIILSATGFILLQPQDELKARATVYKIPQFPWIPIMAVVVGVHLLVRILEKTWLEAGIAIILGVLVYFTYGMRHSVEAPANFSKDEELVLLGPFPRKRMLSEIIRDHRRRKRKKGEERLDTVLIP